MTDRYVLNVELEYGDRASAAAMEHYIKWQRDQNPFYYLWSPTRLDTRIKTVVDDAD